MSLRYRWQAAAELVKRYRDVWRHFWQERHRLDAPILREHEAEFLPAALALQAKPVSPAGRWVARILIALIVVLVVWATLGRIDIVVNGQGKIIPSGETKTIASVEVASVHALHVAEGQVVKAGDTLIELDTREANSDRDKANAELQIASVQVACEQSLLAGIARGTPPHLPALSDVSPEHWQAGVQYLDDQWRDYTAKRARLAGDIARYGAALPLAVQQEADYATLAQTHDVSVDALLQKKQARIELEGNLANARNQQIELTADTRKASEDRLEEATRTVASAAQDEMKASAHGALLKLTSPVNGTVQQLVAHTVGGVVPAAQPLMRIVPLQAKVEFEAAVADRDVGFIHEGQHAAVKIDTFDYSRYGTVDAVVSHVSRDAIEDEKKGLLYSVRVQLDKAVLMVDGREVPLTPGMSGSVDIRTGTRRVIGYVLSPLVQHAEESLRER
ncbi:Leukotoxin export protein LtxD [Paraburkholderia aspalathi]|uniref:HlyD family type I secretion periplasmic adaptor subunit n=1 Tax=Paraburkholderia aspalathi TaxID=1324617 RepID=UPI00190910C6|nr:HlyD family type I secretion periplasmic adaptor subunit [Paraburkholderia aspalathi]MBK3843657.1 HlyD family type I secretion periplasmic adaptor subunit [Paraburkholderia aspalathi]CAE6812455.1 Leukotoxin export protein LtxD [Paraburkholderia aspalathi]CAE6857860.1 Leukotoxin export protein LtxD [Paraburkholderia aspalathi]